MGIERYTIEHSVHVNASPEAIWQEITQVDIASFNSIFCEASERTLNVESDRSTRQVAFEKRFLFDRS